MTIRHRSRRKSRRITRNALLVLALAAGLAALGSVTDACAAPVVIEVSWTPNPESNVAGYVVYRGDNPDTFAEFTDVGNTTSAEFQVEDGSRHYFAVHAYDTMGVRGPLSGVVAIDLTEEITLANPGDRGHDEVR